MHPSSNEPPRDGPFTTTGAESAVPASRSLTVVIPVFNDWTAVSLLLRDLDVRLSSLAWTTSVLLVDDGSTDAFPPEILTEARSNLCTVEILRLRRNLGHQRAIAIGLAYVEANVGCDAAVVMDGDGEDSPGDIPRLIERFDAVGGARVVFAARARRSESRTFRIFYKAYRVLHRVLTGLPVSVGNFSVLPPEALRALVVVSDLWNHFAASVFKAKLPVELVPTDRATRLAGHPTMNFTALVAHGLSAMSVFGDRIGVRGLVAAFALFVVTAAGLGVVVAIRCFSDWAIPGWATVASGVLAIVSIQLLTAMGVFAFVVLGNRDSSVFLASRDHGYFIRDLVSGPRFGPGARTPPPQDSRRP